MTKKNEKFGANEKTSTNYFTSFFLGKEIEITQIAAIAQHIKIQP